MAGYVRRRKFERDQALSTAWHVEAFARCRKLPALETVLGIETVDDRQTPDEMLAAMQAWAAMTQAEGQ